MENITDNLYFNVALVYLVAFLFVKFISLFDQEIKDQAIKEAEEYEAKHRKKV